LGPDAAIEIEIKVVRIFFVCHSAEIVPPWILYHQINEATAWRWYDQAILSRKCSFGASFTDSAIDIGCTAATCLARLI